MKNKGIYVAVLIIVVICLALSILILYEKSNDQTGQNICSAISPSSQCQAVQESTYGRILGIDNPWFGIAGFSALIILSILQMSLGDNLIRKYFIIAGMIFSGLLSLWFLYVQEFLIHMYCIFCLFIDGFSIISLVLGVILLVRALKHKHLT